jgi:hypothetical protein
MQLKSIFIILQFVLLANILFSQNVVLNKTIDSFDIKVVKEKEMINVLGYHNGKVDTL